MKTVNIREVSLDEIVDLPVYPVADIFPMLAENSSDRDSGKADKQTITLAELADSIIENGLQEPIVLFESANGKMLLDGRNRRAACILGKIETVLVEDFIGTDEEADEFVFSLNLDRRDLTPGQRASAAAAYWEIESVRADARKGTRTDLVANLPPSSEFGKTRVILARRFRAGQKYVDLIHKELEAIDNARIKAERLQAEATELERIEKEAEAKIELAKVTGNVEAVKEAAIERNEAASNKTDLRERAAVESEKASTKERKLARVRSGETVNSVYGESKQKETSDDPVGKLRTRINSTFANLKQAISELASVTGQGEDDFNFVGRKISDFIEHFESEFGIEE